MSEIGQIVGPYQIESQIGRGNMATVYRAYQSQLERWVAIKLLGSMDTEFLNRFRREARAIAALRHPNILTIYDYGEEGRQAYIVMEYVAGGTLNMRLTGRPSTWEEAARLIIPIGQALAYAHSQGIIHRDIKPANILLPQPDWPLLADFGLVKILGGQKGITRPGTILGTPAYFAPEQVTTTAIDYRSDIYSLAILLYELLTGAPPLVSASPIETMQRRLQESVPPPSYSNRNISLQLEGVILQALERDPHSRQQTMQEFVNQLYALQESTSPVAPVMPPTNQATTMLSQSGPIGGPRLVVMGTGAVLSLAQWTDVVIGRGSTHNLNTPTIDMEPHGGSQAGVSRQHARFLQAGGNWLVEDLHSTNGTFINERPLQPGQPLPINEGDQIRCSRLVLIFYKN